MKTSDLQPPLGKPGGPCQVIRRVEEQAPPRLQPGLIRTLEHGDDLSNAEASKVYPLDREPGVGIFRQLQVTSHAQYRMDLRGVRVDDVRGAIGNFLNQVGLWQRSGSPAATRMMDQVASGEKVEWVDQKTRLKVVFNQSSPGVANLVTCFWKGQPDPGPPSGSCTLAERVAAKWLSR